MAGENQQQSFWATVPGVLTAVAGVVTAGTGLLVALGQLGVIGSDDDGGPNAALETTSSPASPGPASPSPTAPTETAAEPGADAGDALVGTWRGTAASPDGSNSTAVQLEVLAPCRLRQACGMITVSAVPCTGRVTLWSVRGQTYELYVDKFTEDSSARCKPGAGDFFEVLGDGTLRYTTDYSDVMGVLEPAR